MAKKKIEDVSASGEARALIKLWEQQGRELDNQALMTALENKFPRTFSPSQWRAAVSNAKMQLKKSKEKEEPVSTPSPLQNQQSFSSLEVNDVLTVKEWLSRHGKSAKDLADSLTEIQDVSAQLGGDTEKLEQCLKALQLLSVSQ